MRPRNPMYRVVISSWGRGAGQRAAGRGGCCTRPPGPTAPGRGRAISVTTAVWTLHFAMIAPHNSPRRPQWSLTPQAPAGGGGPGFPGRPVPFLRRRGLGGVTGTAKACACLEPREPSPRPRPLGWSCPGCRIGASGPSPHNRAAFSCARQSLVPTWKQRGHLIRLAGADASHRPPPPPLPSP